MSKSKIYDVTATGSTTPRDIRDRFADVISVRDFGAKGDGVTDDTAAIRKSLQKGADESRTVIFPQGVYRTTSGIFINSTGKINIEGFGATLYLDSSTPTTALGFYGKIIADGIPYSPAISEGAMLLSNVFPDTLKSGDLIFIETTEMIKTDWRTDNHNGFITRVNRINEEGVHISSPWPYYVYSNSTLSGTVAEKLNDNKIKLSGIDASTSKMRFKLLIDGAVFFGAVIGVTRQKLPLLLPIQVI